MPSSELHCQHGDPHTPGHGECPYESHEHHRHSPSCCHGGFLFPSDFSWICIDAPEQKFLRYCAVNELVPDSPELAAEAPPLI